MTAIIIQNPYLYLVGAAGNRIRDLPVITPWPKTSNPLRQNRFNIRPVGGGRIGNLDLGNTAGIGPGDRISPRGIIIDKIIISS